MQELSDEKRYPKNTKIEVTEELMPGEVVYPTYIINDTSN